MAKIKTIIPAQAFEVVRDKIALILIDELENQVGISYRTELDAKVTVERFIPYNESELPAVNVALAKGDFDNQTTIDSDGTYRYNIDVYHKSKGKTNKRGDTLAMINVQALIGVCKAILESPQYITLGFDAPFIMRRHVENIVIAEPADKKDTNSIVMGRITFIVRVPENVDVISANLIAGFDTQVKLGLTEKGYIYTGDNIPVPPTTGGAVTVNEDAFGNVDPGDTLDVPVQNTYGDELGALIGGKWIISDQQYIDSDGSAKSVPAGNLITCSPVDIAALTCQQLNDNLTQSQRQVIQGVKPVKTGQTISYALEDDGAEQEGRLINFLTLECDNIHGNRDRLTDSVGGQDYDGTNGDIPDYMEDHSQHRAFQFNAGFSVFPLATWTVALAAAAAHDNGTFSNFRIPNINTLWVLLNSGATGTRFNYAPINNASTSWFIWSSTTDPDNSILANFLQATGNTKVGNSQKIGTRQSIYVRNI